MNSAQKLTENISPEELKEMTMSLLETMLKKQAECECENCNDKTREFFTDLVLLVHTSRNFKSEIAEQLAVNFATLAIGDIRKFFAMLKTLKKVVNLMAEEAF